MKKFITILIMSLFLTQNVNKLVAFNKKHKDVDQMELGVAIVDSLDGEDIQIVANNIAKNGKLDLKVKIEAPF